MALETPAWLQADSYGAAAFRQALQAGYAGTGVIGSGDLAVTENATPNMSVNVAVGQGLIPGTLGATSGFPANLSAQTGYGLPADLTSQASYAAYQDGTVNLAIAAADPTNPRIDIVVATVEDAQYSGSNNAGVLQVITGTAAPSPSAPSAPASSIVLAQISVAANATSITTADITDERPFAQTWIRPYGVGALFSVDTAGSYAGQPLLWQFAEATGTSSQYGVLQVAFPKAFPNGCLFVAAALDNLGTGNRYETHLLQTSVTASGCQFVFYDNGTITASTSVSTQYMAAGF